MGLGGRLIEKLEDRLGFRSLFRLLMDRKIPPGIGWLHTWGSTLLALLLMQTASGMVLALFYVPSPEHAYHSVRALEDSPLGSFVRGMHFWGANAIIVVALLHLLRVFFMGAYKYPRELTWVVGVLIFMTLLAFGFTGYLLPWDQKAYWATVVGTTLITYAPYVGESLHHVISGGPEVGAATLTRFFAFHVFFLPVGLWVLIVIHLFAVITLGIAVPPTGRFASIPPGHYETIYAEAKALGEPFSQHVPRDLVMISVAVAGVLGLAALEGTPLGARADPFDPTFLPRPEWYFLPFFELLWLFPGPWIPMAAFYLPVGLFVLLLLLPFLDRTPARHPTKRPVSVLAGVLILIALSVLTYQGAMAPLPPGATVSVPAGIVLSPLAREGLAVFQSKGCDACHAIRGVGGGLGPDLTGVARRRDRAWMIAFIRNPQRVIPGAAMPALPLEPGEVEAVVRYLEELGT